MPTSFMALNRNPKPGRPFSTGELAEKQLQLKMTPTQWRRLEDKRGDLPRSTYLKRLLDAAPTDAPSDNAPVPLLGRACCGNAFEIMPFPDGVQIVPPWPVPPNTYALLAVGSSMSGNNDRTAILDGSIVFFQPAPFPALNSIVHVEFNESGRQMATLKKLIELPDGSFALEPLNGDYQTLIPVDESYTIRGQRIRTLAAPVREGESHAGEPKQLAAARAEARSTVAGANRAMARLMNQEPQEHGITPRRRKTG